MRRRFPPYYLVVEKNRLSYKMLNKISAEAVEFGNLIAVSDERMQYLEEHGERLIADRAVSRLRRIYICHSADDGTAWNRSIERL